MNTSTNPSQRTDCEQRLTAGADTQHRDLMSGADAAYKTPQGAEHRTFELTVDSSYEMWLLVTFTGHAGEHLWVSSYLPFQPIATKLTYRLGTLELPEVRWLVDNILQFERGSETLRCAAGDAPILPPRRLRANVLEKVASQLHLYLDDYDIVGLVASIDDFSDRLRLDVATKAIPPADDLAAFEAHLCACIECVRRTYIDDSFLL